MWKLEQHISLRSTLPDKQPVVLIVDGLRKVKLCSLQAYVLKKKEKSRGSKGLKPLLCPCSPSSISIQLSRFISLPQEKTLGRRTEIANVNSTSRDSLLWREWTTKEPTSHGQSLGARELASPSH